MRIGADLRVCGTQDGNAVELWFGRVAFFCIVRIDGYQRLLKLAAIHYYEVILYSHLPLPQ